MKQIRGAKQSQNLALLPHLWETETTVLTPEIWAGKICWMSHFERWDIQHIFPAKSIPKRLGPRLSFKNYSYILLTPPITFTGVKNAKICPRFSTQSSVRRCAFKIKQYIWNPQGAFGEPTIDVSSSLFDTDCIFRLWKNRQSKIAHSQKPGRKNWSNRP